MVGTFNARGGRHNILPLNTHKVFIFSACVGATVDKVPDIKVGRG